LSILSDHTTVIGGVSQHLSVLWQKIAKAGKSIGRSEGGQAHGGLGCAGCP
jgi:hypothetical protein